MQTITLPTDEQLLNAAEEAEAAAKRLRSLMSSSGLALDERQRKLTHTAGMLRNIAALLD